MEVPAATSSVKLIDIQIASMSDESTESMIRCELNSAGIQECFSQGCCSLGKLDSHKIPN